MHNRRLQGGICITLQRQGRWFARAVILPLGCQGGGSGCMSVSRCGRDIPGFGSVVIVGSRSPCPRGLSKQSVGLSNQRPNVFVAVGLSEKRIGLSLQRSSLRRRLSDRWTLHH